MEKRKILLINPSSRNIYKNAIIKDAVPYYPVMSLATIAAKPFQDGHEIKILDFNIPKNSLRTLSRMLRKFNPDFVGITFTTPLFPQVVDISKIIKKYNPKIVIVAGGPHVTSLYEESLKKSKIDIAVISEGDFTFSEIISETDYSKIKGIAYKIKNKIIFTGKREIIRDLNSLPYPAWNLFELDQYKGSPIISKLSPVGFLETSRGCPFQCCYCNKNIFGPMFRVKSPERVVDEIEYMVNFGFKEIYVVDDGFTTNMERAEKICDLIITKKLNFSWTLTNGIRVDRVNKKLFQKMKKAGCYRVAFGLESGNEEVLKDFGKAANLSQARNAVKWAEEAGIETIGYFIFGLPKDNESTMKETIDFAKSLNLSIAKFGILVPYPGTRLYDEWDEKNLIKSKDWGLYNVYNAPSDIYTHPNLGWEIINKYHKKAFRAFYLRPSYIFKRFLRDLKDGNLLNDLKTFLKIKWN